MQFSVTSTSRPVIFRLELLVHRLSHIGCILSWLALDHELDLDEFDCNGRSDDVTSRRISFGRSSLLLLSLVVLLILPGKGRDVARISHVVLHLSCSCSGRCLALIISAFSILFTPAEHVKFPQRRSIRWKSQRDGYFWYAELFHDLYILEPALHQVLLQPEQLLIQIRLPIHTQVNPLLLHVHLEHILDGLVVGHHEVEVGELSLVGPFDERLKAREERMRLSALQQSIYDFPKVLKEVIFVVFGYIHVVAELDELCQRNSILTRLPHRQGFHLHEEREVRLEDQLASLLIVFIG